jgi:hypothetical protein
MLTSQDGEDIHVNLANASTIEATRRDRGYGFLPASKTAPLTCQRPQKKSSKNLVMASVPPGSKGEKRPIDVIGSAVKGMKLCSSHPGVR